MGDFQNDDATLPWVEMYRGVLRMRPVLEPPYADSDEGARVHGEFCAWLRGYLVRHGADEDSLARVEVQAAVECENWHAVWSESRPAAR